MTSSVAAILQAIEALSQPEQQELVMALCDRWGIASESEAADWAESIRDKIDEAYASTEPAVDGSTFIQERRSAIYQGRLQDLQRDALIGWEAAQRGESIDGPTAIAQIRARLHAKHNQIVLSYGTSHRSSTGYDCRKLPPDPSGISQYSVR